MIKRPKCRKKKRHKTKALRHKAHIIGHAARIWLHVNRIKFYAIKEAVVQHFHLVSKRSPYRLNLQYYYQTRNKYFLIKQYRTSLDLIINLSVDIFTFPVKYKWFKTLSPKTFGYYYLGIFDGLRGVTGRVGYKFE